MGCILSAGREQKSYFNYMSHASVLNATQRCCNKVNKIDCNKIKTLDRHIVQITCMLYQACGTRIQHEAKGTTETNNSNMLLNEQTLHIMLSYKQKLFQAAT